jgi:hypothetical protein
MHRGGFCPTHEETADAAVLMEIDRIPRSDKGLPFAITDFDGDLVQIWPAYRPAKRHRCYRVPDSTSALRGWAAICAAPRAPTGGLLIEARDVNGDHAVDLVLRTGWLRQHKAIRLSDGHGSFSRVEPTASPE